MLSARVDVARQKQVTLALLLFWSSAGLAAVTPRAGASLLDAPDLAGKIPAKKMLEGDCAAGDAAACWYLGRTPSPVKAAVLQGPSTATSVRLSAWSPALLQWSFVDATAGRRVVADKFERHGREDQSDEILEYRFDRLKRGHDYRALAFDANGVFADGRKFKVLAPDRKKFRFALASCMDDAFDAEQRKTWPQLLSDAPDFLVLVGDNVYAARATAVEPDQLWRRQRDGREKFLLYRAERLVPVFSTWDDHDYGVNDGDGTYVHRAESLAIHRAFFATGPGDRTVTNGPGASIAFDVGGARFVLADDRSFRKPGDVWGAEQTAWILARIADAKGIVFLANGHQYFGAYHPFESFERYAPIALKAFATKVSKAKPPVVLLSGDRHLAELQKLEPALFGYETWELTSSAIHAKTYPDAWAKAPNARQTDGKSGAMNYALVDVSPKTLRFRARGIDDAVFFDRSVPVPRR